MDGNAMSSPAGAASAEEGKGTQRSNAVAKRRRVLFGPSTSGSPSLAAPSAALAGDDTERAA
ncbi:MAG: hypothetical protein AVDCRST_MAG90-850 [uncultured Microvirga sp.]|uniref:Uncharacterized protein n=1 Tax=uncultured Microvirga sp. TaxID=412392 RepID=A0A6J4KZ65_9HYPH|nr:MAG: hypothetical protein AVDCRST_MAG90-850 [uncultured Microvirga sp.]